MCTYVCIYIMCIYIYICKMRQHGLEGLARAGAGGGDVEAFGFSKYGQESRLPNITFSTVLW